jgi:hypothetical protein
MGIGERYVDQIRDTYQTMYPIHINMPHNINDSGPVIDWALTTFEPQSWAYFTIDAYQLTTFCFKHSQDAMLFSLRWSS